MQFIVNAFKALGAVGIIALVIVLVIIGPFITVWALNTLFPALAIPYTLWVWLAVSWLCYVFFGDKTSK